MVYIDIMNKKKNKGAVHLGKLSAKARKKKAGNKKEFSKRMAYIRSFGKQKEVIPTTNA